MRTRPGKSAAKLRRREQVDLGRDLLADRSVHTVRERVGQPVDERQARVHLDREAAVRAS